MKPIVLLLAVAMSAGPGWVSAQGATTASTADAQPASTAVPASIAAQPAPSTEGAAVAAVDCSCIPAGTVVELEIAAPLNSSLQKRGDKFAIRLHAPLMQGGSTVLQAGIAGEGEIIHAEKSRGGGKPGEMLLAARYLDAGGTHIALRALKFGGQGQDKTKVALGVAMAIGPFAHFIRGREIEIPAGTVVNAKLAQDLPLPAPTAIRTEAAIAPVPASAPHAPVSAATPATAIQQE